MWGSLTAWLHRDMPEQVPVTNERQDKDYEDVEDTSMCLKRMREDSDEDYDMKGIMVKKPKRVDAYIYYTLFLSGEGSDVTIRALDKQWKLHRMFLKQCGYFKAMFEGHWKDSEYSVYDMTVTDRNINVQALDTVFAALYYDRNKINVNNIVGVVAAATWLQLDGLLERCAMIVERHLDEATVLSFCMIAYEYNNLDMQSCVLRYLELRLFVLPDDIIASLPRALIIRLAQSSHIFVIHIELDLYVLCRTWMYLQICPMKSETTSLPVKRDHFAKECQSYFLKRTNEPAFLDTELGRPYLEIFTHLRYHAIMNDPRNILLLQQDNIIPEYMYHDTYKRCWLNMLSGGMEAGSTLEKDGIRCGRKLERDTQIMWRWTGFTYGFDLLVNYCSQPRRITVKRNTTLRPTSFHSGNSLSCTYDKRRITFNMQVASFTSTGTTSYHDVTDTITHDFSLDEELM
eukprot:Ihof_evm11s114 gene=Ihof_evmTU11s114